MAGSPEEDWDRWAIKKLSKTNMTYLEALQLEKQKEEVSETDLDILNEPMSKKRKIMNRKKDASFVTDYSSTEEILIPPPPKIKIVVERNIESDDTASLASGESMPPPQVTPSSPVDLMEHVTGTSQIAEETVVNSLNNIDLPCLNTSTSSASENIDKKLDHILNNTINNRILLERISLRIDKGSTGNSTDMVVENLDTLPKKAFKRYEALMLYENEISASDQAHKQLEMAFYLCGGSRQEENIKRGLRRIFSDKLAKKCSLYGRKGNYKIGNLKILNILRAAVRRNYPKMTDKEFESYVGQWLRQANLRYQRSKKNV